MATVNWGAGISLKGLKGDAGVAGISVLSGTGAPGSLSGVESQVYVDTQNGVLYKYTGGAWTNAKSLVGPMGLNGINGSFFTGVGAPTSATYSGSGQAIYIQTTGEVWTYTSSSTGWVDSGENLTGPQGTAGSAGIRGTQTYTGNGAPSTNLSSFSPPAMSGDLYYDMSGGPTLYVLSVS